MSPTDFRTFHYHNGVQEVKADPFRVMRELVVILGGDPNAVIQAAREKPPARPPDITTEQEEAYRLACDAVAVRNAESQHRLAAAARQAFNLPPFDELTGRGPLDDECLDTVYRFLDWLKKKRTSGGTPPASVASSAAPPSSGRDLFHPTPPSASSSTPTDCGCE